MALTVVVLSEVVPHGVASLVDAHVAVWTEGRFGFSRFRMCFLWI